MLAKPYLKSGPDQISYVTSDLERAIEILREDLGVGQFVTMHQVLMTNQIYAPGFEDLVFDVAIAWSGSVFIEIIQPFTRDIMYGSTIDENRFILRLHHVAFEVSDWALLLADLREQRKELTFSAEIDGLIKSGYLDARGSIGSFIEYYQVTAAGATVWEQIRAGKSLSPS